LLLDSINELSGAGVRALAEIKGLKADPIEDNPASPS
jgi:hypothetical protein